jgi:long-chain acyl-CoA synthetase
MAPLAPGGDYQSLIDFIDGLAERGAATALIDCTAAAPRHLSYAELAAEVTRLSAGLLERGLAAGAPVLLCGPNSTAWIVAYLAILRAGGMVIPLDPASDEGEMARVIAENDLRWAFTSLSRLPAIRAARQAEGRQIWLLEGEPDSAGAASWRELMVDHSPPAVPAGPEVTAALLYTSGTTGRPKAVPLTHANILSNIEALAAAALAGAKDRVLLPLPLHHAYPCTVGLLGTLASGGAVVLPAGVSGPQLVSALKSAEVSILLGVPRLYSALLAGLDARMSGHGSLLRIACRELLALSLFLHRRCGISAGRLLFAWLHRGFAPNLRSLACGGAALAPETAWRLEALGWRVLTGYGLTETSPLLSFSSRQDRRPDTVGRPLPGIEIRIEKWPGQNFGELLVRGPSVFSGYRGDPEATRKAFAAGGWLRTGDLGFLDDEGYLHIVGRAKEQIVLPDGKNISPEEIESVYSASPLVKEMAVLEQDGALMALFVPDAESLRAHGAASLRQLMHDDIEDISLSLPPHKRLAGYRITLAALPRTQLGKLRRHLLADLYAGAESGSPPVTSAPPGAADCALLSSRPACDIWAWLGERFPETRLTLDTSPQLDLQIDSLGWVSLSLEIQQNFGIELTGEALGRIVTLRDLLQEANAASASPAGPAAPAADATLPHRPGPLLGGLGLVLYTLNRLVIRTLFRLRVDGMENLPRQGPFVVTPNHSSYLDPLVVAAALPPQHLNQVCWAGWTGIMFGGPFSRLLSRATRVFPVDPDRAPGDSLALGNSVLSNGGILVWFPEGRRSRDGSLGAFHPGVGLLLQHAGAPAVPTAILGTFEALPSNRRLPRLRPLRLVFGSPESADDLAARGEGIDSPARIAEALRRAVAGLLPKS